MSNWTKLEFHELNPISCYVGRLMGFALGFELRPQDWGLCKGRRWGPRSYGLRIYLGRWMYYRQFGHADA